MAKILRGKEVTDALNEQLLARAESLRQAGTVPCLAIVRVGERPDDLAYEKGATTRSGKTGVEVQKFAYPEDITQEALIAEIEKINREDAIHGVLLFCPLPKHINEEVVRNALSPEKDLDGITEISQAGVYAGTGRGYPPCTAEACMEILHYYGIDPKGKNVAVIGRSQVIGKPVAMMLMQEHATVTVCHTKTQDMAAICRDKDILIAAAGHRGTVTRDFLAPGQTVIDVAINFDAEGNLCGDVDFAAAEDIVAAVTPVPGGVGGVTTSILMKHCIQAAERKQN